jgi:hypothetical protein
MTTQQYHVAILQATGDFGVESFDTLEQLTARIKELLNTDVYVACFHGARVMISKPPMRYLMLADAKVPLFDVPALENLEPDDTTYLGADPAILEGPAEIALPQKPKASEDSENFFSDDTDGIVNVFDSILPDPDS